VLGGLIGLLSIAMLSFVEATDRNPSLGTLIAIPTDDPNVVLSPYVADCRIDVTGILPGERAIDPHSKRQFIVPLPGQRGGGKDDGANTVDDEQGVGAGSATGESVKLPEKMAAFIDRYLEARAGNDPAASVQFLNSPKVENYYGKKGLAVSDAIDTRCRLIERWPSRTFKSKRKPVVLGREFGVYSVILDLSTKRSNALSEIAGSERLLIKIADEGGTYRIVHIEDTAG